MPAERVLIQVDTIAHMAGIKQAQAGMLGMGASTLLLAAGLGVLVAGAKSMIDISEKHTAAEVDLANAVKNRGANQAAVNSQVEDFITTNKGYYDSQVDVIRGYATLIREGVKAKDVTALMGTALNISAVEGIGLSDAILLIQSAEAGQTRGLKKLVGVTLEAIPAHDTLAQKQKIMAHNMALVAAAYKHGTDTLTPLQVSTHKMSDDWETLAQKGGPVLTAGIDFVITKVTDLYDAFEFIGKDDKIWSSIDDRLIHMAQGIQIATKPLIDAINYLDQNAAGGGHVVGRAFVPVAPQYQSGPNQNTIGPNSPGMPAKITPAQAKAIAESIRRQQKQYG